MSRIVVLLLLFGPSFSIAADWPHWRGPDRNDVSPDASGWDGKTWLMGELWQASVGEGSSSPIVVDGRVYLTGWLSNRDTLFCLDADSGKELWRQSYASPKYGRFAVGDQGIYSGACSTPELDAATGLLFTLGTDGALSAWDTKQNGKPVWSINIYDRYKAQRRPEVAVRKKTQRDYGYVSSPLAISGQLIVEVGSKSGNLVAFDPHSGRELWKSENRDEAGHTGGPVPMTVEGVPCVAVLTLRNLVVTRIDNRSAGRTVATFPWTTDFGNNIATVAVSGNSAIVTSAYNHYAMCRVDVSLRGAKKVWENELASGVCSPIIHDGRVYWAWRGVHCVDFATGKELWTGGKVGSQGSCIVTGDDRLIVYANKGDLSLVETARRSPNKFTQLAEERILSRTDAWPHVVLSGGRIICRDRSGTVRCLAVSSELAAKAKSLAGGSPRTTPPSSTKPPRAVTLKGKWPGTKDSLAFAWDRRLTPEVLQTSIAVPFALTMDKREKASLAKDGSLQLDGGAFLLDGAEDTLMVPVAKELSIELVLTPSRTKQSGPARIFSFSKDGFKRNFTIGQEGDQLLLRLRTTRTGENGMKPQTMLGRLPTSRTHLIVSYRPGKLICWINGKKTVSTSQVQGDFSNWDRSYRLLIGDEFDGGSTRKWRGRIERFAVYRRAMADSEVQQRWQLSKPRQ